MPSNLSTGVWFGLSRPPLAEAGQPVVDLLCYHATCLTCPRTTGCQAAREGTAIPSKGEDEGPTVCLHHMAGAVQSCLGCASWSWTHSLKHTRVLPAPKALWLSLYVPSLPRVRVLGKCHTCHHLAQTTAAGQQKAVPCHSDSGADSLQVPEVCLLHSPALGPHRVTQRSCHHQGSSSGFPGVG